MSTVTTRSILAVSLLMVLVGTVARVAPLFDQGGRLFRQFPSEDGYLMLTMARNMALGHGLSVSDGTIATNGTQPAVTALGAAVFVLAGGDKRAGVLWFQILSVLVALAGAALVFLLACTLLAETRLGAPLAALTAACWYASPLTVRHSMNCMETGVYAALVVFILLVYPYWSRSQAASSRSGPDLAMGLLLGIAFWVRNDAVFLVAAICVTRAVHDLGSARALWSAIRAGLVALLVSMPWLIFNYTGFGHIVPISGLTESAFSTLGQNLTLVPVKLGEYLLPIVDLEPSLERLTATKVLACLWVAAIAFLALPLRARLSVEGRRIALVGIVYGAGLCLYYGVFFGAPWFLSRFLFPLSPLLLVCTAVVVSAGLDRTAPRAADGFVALAATLLLVHVAFVSHAQYRHGTAHRHFQVVEWVDENVAEDEWVGAIQSGTLGFFHDRTYNLDGKVNPDALRARMAGRHQEYIVASPIKYFADWASFEWWRAIDVFAADFELIVEDTERNLSVFRRRSPPRIRPEAGREGAGVPSPLVLSQTRGTKGLSFLDTPIYRCNERATGCLPIGANLSGRDSPLSPNRDKIFRCRWP